MTVLAGVYAVCRLPPTEPIPSWPAGDFVSITRTPDELSIICLDETVPNDVKAERGWRALRVEGPLPFEMTGIAAAFTAPLAAAKISVFVVATFDTDYVLVKSGTFERAVEALRDSGIVIGT